MIDIAAEGLIWFAGIVTLIGTLGMLRFPDFYTRAHAATMVSIGGFTLALLGIGMQNLFGIYFTKIVLVLVVNLITNPTATHALADAAYDVGLKPYKLVRDDLENPGGAGK
jgi:multicomponent Na+:H+ antiporter subunit G